MVRHCVVLLKRLRYPSTLHYSLILLLNWWGFGMKTGNSHISTAWDKIHDMYIFVCNAKKTISDGIFFLFCAFVLIFLKIYFWNYLKKRFVFSFYFIFSVGMQIVKIWEAAMTSAMLSSFFPIVTKWINN